LTRAIVWFLATAAVAAQAPAGAAVNAPAVDHHQHLFSAETGALGGRKETVDAGALIRVLDSAGIRRAVVLSAAYQFGNPNRPAVPNEYERVKAENDWTAEQVAKFPDRLVGFCGVNPLKDYAVAEIERCARNSRLSRGLKMHFGNSDVQLTNHDHVETLRRVFRAANDHRMAIVVHMRPSVTLKRPYGAEDARIFLNEVIPAAPDVVVQIAHLCGAGGFDDPGIEPALGVFVDAVAARDARMARVYFDVSGVAGLGQWTEKVDRIASRIRQLGVERVLFGSDTFGTNDSIRKAWQHFAALPLTADEFRTIADNVAPYMR
jgi:predicted TIM-barrel fold metal-dependent hydrolase